MLFSQKRKEQWSLIEKLIFRFLFSYLILYILFILFAFSLDAPLRWFAENILHWGADFKTHSTGSGDRAFDFVRLAFNLFSVLLIVPIWSIIDKKRLSYNKLFYWFQVTLRYTLIIAMLIYGLAKIFKGQFADPSLERLLQPVGMLSPMGLAWTFMGHSFFYNMFIGFAEILGGLLLLFRKTTTLGSLVIVGIMSNVVMMNFTYDIPVKVFSSHLLFMATILLLADAKRLIDFFFKNKAVERVEHYLPNMNGGFKKIIAFSKKLVVVLMLATVLIQSVVQFKATKQLEEKSAFHGIWEVQSFIQNNDTIPAELTKSMRWQYLIIDQKKEAVVKKITNVVERYKFELKSEEQEIDFLQKNSTVSQHFTYQLLDQNQLFLNGVLNGDTLQIQFAKKPLTDFKLLNQKFQWRKENTF